ncbi:TPA: hypothetical protein ACROI3_002789, partial [Klebsiella pneumoniae]|nr:hypothetical protein [Klebsiella pneumoniae]
MANIEKLGSSSPEVLLKNATNLDKLVNGRESESLPDRFGVLRKTWHGMEMIFSRFIDYITGRGEQAVAAIGWQELGNWAVGLAVDNRQQIVYYNGSWYKYLGELEHVIAGDSPENDGGVWSAANPTGKWSNIGDAALRSNLGSSEGTKLIVVPGAGNTLYDWINGQLRSLFYYLSPAKIASVIGGTATDITAELQAAMNDNIPIWIPKGSYFVTQSITASANSGLIGPGPREAIIDNLGSSHLFIIGAGGYIRGWKEWKGFAVNATGNNTKDAYAFYYSDRQDANGAPVYTIAQVFSEIEINAYGKLGGGWYLQECFRVVISNCGATGLSQPFRLVG